MTIERVRTGGPWEEKIGFARAVAAGDRVLVAGTMPLIDGVLQGEGDPYVQTKVALANALEALTPFGLGAEAVLRTRLYLTHLRDVDAGGPPPPAAVAPAPPAPPPRGGHGRGQTPRPGGRGKVAL
ncbi:Rid family hydrolase, partial [Streptomyces platensis]